jgi:hypothetical protein
LERTTICQIDRFEGDVAVLIAGGSEVLISRSLIPAEAAVGDTLTIRVSGDPDAAAELSLDISRLQERLKNGEHLGGARGEDTGEGPQS